MRETIGLAKETNGLYHLNVPSDQNRIKNKFPVSYLIGSSISYKDKIWLYHLYLGHSSLYIFKALFPSLFQELDVDNFILFSFIRSEVWGPFKVLNILGARWLLCLLMIVFVCLRSFFLSKNLM